MHRTCSAQRACSLAQNMGNTMSTSQLLLSNLGLVAACMTLLWLLSLPLKNVSIVDIFWGPGFAVIAMATWLLSEGNDDRKWLLTLLTTVWAARLGIYLAKRLAREKEDGRYRMLAEKWGEKTQRNLFVFFQIQALWAVMFAVPMLAAASNPTGALGWTDFLAVAIFAVGVLGESVADAQLERFRSNPANAGRVCREGLWAWSRHPNYFFEWVHWWAWVLLAVGGPLVSVAVALAGPVLMYVFITRLTGIPPVEKRAVVTRGDAYREYQSSTSSFFPRRPKTREKLSEVTT